MRPIQPASTDYPMGRRHQPKWGGNGNDLPARKRWAQGLALAFMGWVIAFFPTVWGNPIPVLLFGGGAVFFAAALIRSWWGIFPVVAAAMLGMIVISYIYGLATEGWTALTSAGLQGYDIFLVLGSGPALIVALLGTLFGKAWASRSTT